MRLVVVVTAVISGVDGGFDFENWGGLGSLLEVGVGGLGVQGLCALPCYFLLTLVLYFDSEGTSTLLFTSRQYSLSISRPLLVQYWML